MKEKYYWWERAAKYYENRGYPIILLDKHNNPLKGQFPLSIVHGLGLKCGHIPGTDYALEVITIKTKNDKTGTLLKALEWHLRTRMPKSLYSNLTFAETPDKEYQILYRCRNFSSNMILAKGEDQKPLIELKGQGAYTPIAPTKGFKFLNEYPIVIPMITRLERSQLHELCRDFNELSLEAIELDLISESILKQLQIHFPIILN